MKIRAKIILFSMLLVVLAILGEVYISNLRNAHTIQKAYNRELDNEIKLSEQFIEDHFSRIKSQLVKVIQDEGIQLFIKSGGQEIIMPSDEEMLQAIENELPIPEPIVTTEFIHSFIQLSDASNVYVLNNRHDILLSKYTENNTRLFKEGHQEFLSTHNRFFTSKVIRQNDSTFYSYSSLPLKDDESGIIGRIVVQTDITALLSAFSLSRDHQKTGELVFTYTFNESDSSGKNTRIHYINKTRLLHGVSRPAPFFKRNNPRHPAALLIAADSGKQYYNDYLEHKVYSSYKYSQALGIGIIAKIDNREINNEHSSLDLFTVIISVIIFLTAILLALFFAKVLTTPFMRLKKALSLVSRGILPKKIHASSNDEIGKMTQTVNTLVDQLKKTAEFANNIGRGEFEANFQPSSEQDTLGKALVDMRESLQKADKQDNLRNWIVTGVAEIGEILRNNDSLDSLGDEIIAYVCERIGAVQGAFYTVNDEDQSDIFIEMKASYAYKRKKYLKAQFRFAEGLIGQSAIEQDTILRTEVPDNYVKITSGILGEQKPSCLLVVPLITNETVYGVIEFSGLNKFTNGEVQYVEEISEIIARTIFSIKVNARTRELLGESQRMSSELQIQQEELRQNAVEMEATQEELKHTNQQLEHQIEEVNFAQKRMQVLLENASEVITIYEKDGTVRYVSPSVENILGYKQEDLIGMSDIKFVDEKGQKGVKKMFKSLRANPDEQVTLQFTYKKKNGDNIWLEATGRNMLKDPAIQGIVVNSSDITERRRAEEEERKRGQMQALSENSLDLITRISDKGNFFYINPTIKALTGLDKDYFKNKNLDDVSLNEQIINAWKEIVGGVFQNKSKISREMDFPANDQDRIMQVNAIPEYNEDSEIESVLVVSHDITDRKAIENEIRQKNKKINDSINYAERIQDAILPNSEIIKRDLPQSFIYFLPRDVVSGDFPWYQKVGDEILISAVDCTGHGVPGALISIIAYFLLQDVVDQGIHQPGEVLDTLDQLVTKTLRQDEESSKLKDGMDMGFCRINLNKGTVEYSGAHRPLYLIRNGELIEFKGNRFPIGGGNLYHNKTNFTNHQFEIQPGDTIYFFSDGYPDQFGGPENRKLGAKRVKEMLTSATYDSFEEMETKVGNVFQEWKGEVKQTDDVLLIGIQF